MKNLSLFFVFLILSSFISCTQENGKRNNLKIMTMKKDTTFKIISFTPDNIKYFPGNIMEKSSWMDENYVKHTELNIPLGKSRYGGPIIDLPQNLEHPKDLRFVAQLDLQQFSLFDNSGLIPKEGQLFVFADITKKKGKVIYSNSLRKNLNRIIVEHNSHFFLGTLIDKIFSDTESYNERYVAPEHEEFESTNLNEEGKIWDPFAGTQRSKIFGIYTDCQRDEKYIRKITSSEKVILLQIGKNGFNDEGVLTILITKDDLKNRNFDNCEVLWSQS